MVLKLAMASHVYVCICVENLPSNLIVCWSVVGPEGAGMQSWARDTCMRGGGDLENGICR